MRNQSTLNAWGWYSSVEDVHLAIVLRLKSQNHAFGNNNFGQLIAMTMGGPNGLNYLMLPEFNLIFQDLASLEYSQETEGPYCSDLPTPDDIHRLLELECFVARHSVSCPSSHHQGTSSHQDDDDDDDDVKTSRASTPSPTTYLNSLNLLEYQNYQMPSASEQTDETLFKRQTIFLNQTQ
ncbi:hypothetical protein Tco_1438912 [Tanacetum coccineum]